MVEVSTFLLPLTSMARMRGACDSPPRQTWKGRNANERRISRLMLSAAAAGTGGSVPIIEYAFYHVLLQRERELIPTALDFHDPPFLEAASHDLFGQGVFDVLLNHALQRPCPVGGVIAPFSQPAFGFLVDLERDPLLDQLLIEALDLDVHDLHI